MDLISISDLSKKDIEKILNRAAEIKKGKKVNLAGKILATLFFEPSTRTKLSFHSAALRNKMGYIDFTPETSSLVKGESFEDTVKILSGYADILAIRSPTSGSAEKTAEISDKPVINAGDGANQHPTQTLIDLFTIKEAKGKLTGLKVTLYGDLKHGRSMRSLFYGLAAFGADITLISPKGLEMDKRYLDDIRTKFTALVDVKNEPEFSDSDVLYVCRIQKERFTNPVEAERITKKFYIRKEQIKNMIVLHPLPKVEEMDKEIDKLPNAKYFEQAHNGVPVRQALLEFLLHKR